MRRKLAFLALVVVVAIPALAGSSSRKTAVDLSRSNGCPKGSHLINCPQGSFCCPNGALCTCGPF